MYNSFYSNLLLGEIMDLRFTIDDKKFNVRACGFLIHNDKYLIVKEQRDIPIMKLIGGAVEWGECTEEAVQREFYEETGLHVQVDKLKGIVELFWEFQETPAHQIIFVYQLSLTNNIGEMPKLHLEQVAVDNPAVSIEWIARDEFKNLRPSKLHSILESDIFCHFIERKF